MPIGKNAIKRVENNGYSNVKSNAPDMENSHVIASPDVQVVEKIVQPIEAKAQETKKPAPKKKSAPKKTVKAKANAFQRVSFGEELPYYLL